METNSSPSSLWTLVRQLPDRCPSLCDSPAEAGEARATPLSATPPAVTPAPRKTLRRPTESSPIRFSFQLDPSIDGAPAWLASARSPSTGPARASDPQSCGARTAKGGAAYRRERGARSRPVDNMRSQILILSSADVRAVLMTDMRAGAGPGEYGHHATPSDVVGVEPTRFGE